MFVLFLVSSSVSPVSSSRSTLILSNDDGSSSILNDRLSVNRNQSINNSTAQNSAINSTTTLATTPSNNTTTSIGRNFPAGFLYRDDSEELQRFLKPFEMPKQAINLQ